LPSNPWQTDEFFAFTPAGEDDATKNQRRQNGAFNLVLSFKPLRHTLQNRVS